MSGAAAPATPQQATGEPRVLVSILHYNSPDMGVQTVRCFAQQTYRNLKLQLVDNCSRPETVEQIRRAVPDLDTTVLAANEGYTGGNNHALRQALRDGYDYALVCNEDIEVDERAVAHLVETARARPDAGVVGAIEVAHATGIPRAVRGRGFSLWTGRVNWLMDAGSDPGAVLDADYVQGAMVLFTRAALERGLLFDENLFIYYDEVDVGLRMQRLGLRAYVDTRVTVRHKNNPLSFNPRCGYLHQRNRLYLVRKYGRWYHRAFYHAYAAGVELPVKWAVRTAQGHGRFARACVVGHLDAIQSRLGRGKVGEV